MFATLEKRVRDIVEERDQGRWPLTSAMLGMVSMAYGAGVCLRARLYERGLLATHRLPCKVIAIGNLTVGGTGKSPMTVYVARRLQQQGKRVAVISRGYKGAAEKSGGVVSDGRRLLMGPAQAGDEPYMMAHQLPGVPVLVGKDRYRSGLAAIDRFQPDVIILDDGYQHLRLHRDLNILLLDARKPFGNGRLLPRGKLREPLAAGQRADIIVFTRARNVENLPIIDHWLIERPQFRSDHTPIFYQAEAKAPDAAVGALRPIDPAMLVGQPLYAFSGIADNEAFIQSLKHPGLTINGVQKFGDHHEYQNADLAAIRRGKHETQSQWIVTTEKDYYRLSDRADLLKPLIVVGIDIVIDGSATTFDSMVAAPKF